MARQLWLLRHGEAEPHGTRADSERQLTPRGEQQSRAAGAALGRLGARFDAVLSSPKVRARRTAELAVEGLGGERECEVREYEPLASGFEPSAALQVLEEVAAAGEAPGARVLLVGHEPDLSGVVAGLCGGNIDLKKGGLAVVRLDGARGELVAVLRPREIALIAGVPAGGE
ncbi:MAG TPA: phosphohistidine phosphatase SixA [Solirubrobacteraceae bacterium]|jgi:phosphohistidine phosphatase|nr:phosphohistidine phosphatase SixA [Solirubrobacteraceae bacterium]